MIQLVIRALYAIPALLVSACWPAARGAAQPADADFTRGDIDVAAPSASRRITARFDFEPIPGDTSTLPANWIRAQHDPPLRVRPGFPIWNRGELDRAVAHTGTGSARLDIEGGSASLLLDPGVIQVFADADYAVVARVRTLGVDVARARLVARLLDRAGEPVPGSEVSSPATQTRGAWLPIVVRVPGDHPESVSLQIELLFEQPGPDPRHPAASLEIKRQDYQGSAWFDDITVLQIPRVEAWVDEPANLVIGDESPDLGVFVRDLVVEPLTIVYELHDDRGDLVDRDTTDFQGGRLEAAWSPEIDRYGWYRATVAVQRGETRIGSAQTAFIWAPEDRTPRTRVSARDATPFSLSVQRVPDGGLRSLGELALAAGVPRVLTSLYADGTTVTPERVQALGELANLLAREGSEVGLAIDTLPPEQSEVAGPTPVLRAMADGDADGADWLEPILVDLGHRVRWWRAGSFDESLDGLAIGHADGAITRLRDLVPGAILEMPWSAFDTITPGVVRPGVAVAQRVDPSIVPEEVPNLLADFAASAEADGTRGWERPEHTAVFRVIGDRRPEIDEALLGAIHAWAGFNRDGLRTDRGRSVRLDDAWTWQDGRRPQLVPRPVAGAWLTLIDLLRHRKAEIIPRVAPGVRGVLLTPVPEAPERTDSVAVFWPEAGPEPAGRLSMLLAGESVRTVDIFGNTETIEPVVLENSSVRTHEIPLGDGPTFVRGVEPDLVRFQASVRLDPDRVRSDTDPQEAMLRVENPWATSIQGEFFVLEPGNLSTGSRAEQDRRWDIDPRFGSFVLAPGSETGLPIVFDVSPAVGAGPTEMVVDIDLSSPTISDFLRIERTIEVGLENIRMDLVAGYEPGPEGADVVVYVVVTNTGDTPENISLSVSAPGFNRQRSAATPALPGRRMIKAFPFRGGRALLAGEEVVVGLTIRESGERLRDAIRIDDGN
jgi:hypothetical protein